MGVEIAISIAREETRVAVLDNGVVTDLYGDRAKDQDFVGNIYKGRVAKVLPGHAGGLHRYRIGKGGVRACVRSLHGSGVRGYACGR